MKVSVMLRFCLVLPFFVLLVTVSFAMRPLLTDPNYRFLQEEQTGLPKFTQKSSQTASCPKEKGITSSDDLIVECLYVEEEEEEEEQVKNKDGSIIVENPFRFKITNVQKGFTQKLDHFNSTDTRYWTQRYLINKGKYEKGRAVFLLLGGTDEIQRCDLKTGIWDYFAQETSALILYLEHRFYGQSYATNTNYSTEDLVYLNTEQALADIVYFVDEITHHNPKGIDIPPDATWIAMGSAYGGTLAALFKMKFPHKIRAAIAENAPLLPILDIPEYYKALEDYCRSHQLIADTLEDAFRDLRKRFSECAAGDRECVIKHFNSLKDTFNFCTSDHFNLAMHYEVEKHKAFLYWSLTTTIGLALLYGNDNNRTVKTDVIKILLDKDNEPIALNRLGLAVKKVLTSHSIGCLIVDYSVLVLIYQNDSLFADKEINYILYEGLGNRQYVYQRCSEWGHFETANKEYGIFAKLIQINFYQNFCLDVFGYMFNSAFLDRAITRTLMFYGGQEIKVRDVFFIISDDDFWHKLGYLGRIPRDKITKEDNFTFVLKDDREESISQDNKIPAEEESEHQAFVEMIKDWKFMLKKLKIWSGIKVSERTDSVGMSHKGEQEHMPLPDKDRQTVSIMFIDDEYAGAQLEPADNE